MKWGNGNTQRKAPETETPFAGASADTVRFFERAAQTERELAEANETITILRQQVDDDSAHFRTNMAERDREIAFLRHQLEVAEGKRDRYHLRAVAAETTLLNVSNTLIEQASRTRAERATDERPHENAPELEEKPASELLFLQECSADRAGGLG